MVLRALGAIALLILSASAVTARGPYGSVKIGNWSGGAFTHDTTGAFTGCVASAPYKSGITVVVMVSPEVTWNLGFVHNTTGRSNRAPPFRSSSLSTDVRRSTSMAG